MAVKRMISSYLIESDRFMEMSHGAQLLYFYLNITADDDGFTPAVKDAMRRSRTGEEDLRQLIERGYVIPFSSGVIVIRHWLIHNALKEKTYHPTIYTDEKSLLGAGRDGDYQLLELLPNNSKNLDALQNEKGKVPLSASDLRNEYRNVNFVFDKYFLSKDVKSEFDKDSKSTLEKEREEEIREEKERGTPAFSEKGFYGAEKNIFLLPEEYQKLCEKYEQVGSF